ncbi:hypothetical protein QMI71_004578 [Salmonella enterica]|nr:hypothetical protein [Salmonella enterica]
MKSKDSFIERNRWLIPLFSAIIILTAQQIIKSMPEIGFAIPDMLIYIICGIGFTYAGFLNVVAGTTTAKIFRYFVVSGLVVVSVWKYFIL